MADPDQDQDQAQQLTIGERLRLAREAKGMSLDEIANQTRIPVRHLQHIESEDWEALPAITYSIGFVRSYANMIGLDGPALGAELRQQLGSGRRTGVVPEYYEPADPARVPPRSLAIAAAVIAAVLVAAYLIFRSGLEGGAEPAPVAQAPAPAAQPDANRQAATPQNAAGQPVVLAATEEVWLRVYEAEGRRKLFEGTLRPGQQYQVPADARRPQLVTGRANVLRVTVGQTAIPQLGPAERRISDVSLLPEDLVARAGGTAPAPQPPAR
jgi:transcriptional regulator with XRE-family HTH domain